MKILKHTLIVFLAFIISQTIDFGIGGGEVYANPPSFEADYKSYLMGEKGSNKSETLRDMSKIGIDKNKSFKDNIKNIFYPDVDGQGGRLWDIIKVLGLIVFIVMIVVQGFKYVMSADVENKAKDLHRNFVYIFLGGLIFFSSTWILGIGLHIGGDGGSTELMNKIDQSLMFQIFSGLRALAFFIAIILLIFTGWKIMVAMDQEDKFKAGTQGIFNIIIPLIIIKIIDYIYYIAQSPDLKGKATTLIIEVSKALGYILGGFFTLMIIYYGFRLMFGGSDDHLKKVKNIIVGVFLGSLVIFIFFLIIYQIAQEFVG